MTCSQWSKFCGKWDVLSQGKSNFTFKLGQTCRNLNSDNGEVTLNVGEVDLPNALLTLELRVIWWASKPEIDWKLTESSMNHALQLRCCLPMVLLNHCRLWKYGWGDLDYFPCDLAGYRAIPMVHWYQWCNWYQQKSTSFKWFYWWICISWRGLRLFSVWSNWVQGNSDSRLVLMVRLVPIEKDAIPVVLLVKMHPIKVI